MSAFVKTAFHPDVIPLKLAILVPGKEIDGRIRRDLKYQQIASSLQIVGLIEPLVVFPSEHGRFRILDGNKRFDILNARQAEEVECVIATDDESYTYNKRANYLSAVAEHQMILRALAHNSIERIASALNVNVDSIRRKRNLLDGVCKEAVELLKDRRVSPRAFAALRKMKPVRQVEAAELMIASNMYSGRFAAALLLGTAAEMLLFQPAGRPLASVSAAQKLKMEHETEELLKNLKTVEDSYGREILTFTVACRYVSTLLGNARVHQYILGQYPEILRELEALAASLQSDQARVSLPRKRRRVPERNVSKIRKVHGS